MARILVMAIDKTDPNPRCDRRMYKQGDVVEVRPDDMGWGTMETLPLFWRIEIPEETPNDIDWLTEIEWEDPDAVAPHMSRRRRRYFRLNHIPVANRNELADTGTTTLTLAQFEGAMAEKS